MKVIRFFVPGSSDNYNHLLICEKTKETAVVDPYDSRQVSDLINHHKLKLSKILITHEHGDHTQGISDLVDTYQVPVYGHKDIAQVSNLLSDDQDIKIGSQSVKVLFTPGHTAKHFCFLGQNQLPFLICADTVFNAGVGNTYSGNTDELFYTIESLNKRLLPETQIYPAHDYMLHNLAFSLSLEPSNSAAIAFSNRNSLLNSDTREITSWRDEQSINPFLRLKNPTIKMSLENKTGQSINSDLEMFRALRGLRNNW